MDENTNPYMNKSVEDIEKWCDECNTQRHIIIKINALISIYIVLTLFTHMDMTYTGLMLFAIITSVYFFTTIYITVNITKDIALMEQAIEIKKSEN